MLHVLYFLSKARLYTISKNTNKRVSTIVEYMARQDDRMEELEKSNMSLLAHFVQQKQKRKTTFPFKDKDEVYAYAEAGSFDGLIEM